MNFDEKLDRMTEKERLLYLSAKQVKESAFWKYLIEQLDEEAMYNNQRMLTKLMEGDEKAAIIAGAHMQAIDHLLKVMEVTIKDVEEDQTTGQEE